MAFDKCIAMRVFAVAILKHGIAGPRAERTLTRQSSTIDAREQMDQHDYDILFDAYDDFEEIFYLYQSFERAEKRKSLATIDLVNQRLEHLAQILGLEFALSETCYGEMTRIELRPFSKAEIVNATGDPAGPPSYYVHLPASPENAAFIDQLARKVAGKAVH